MDLPGEVLLPGERLLWAERPRRFRFDALDWLRVVFGLIWIALAFGIPWFSGVGISLVPVVVGVFGLLIAWGSVALRQRTRRRTTYAVTDRRIVVADRRSGATTASAYLVRLPPPVVRAGRDGIGDVTFGGSGGLLEELTTGANPASPQHAVRLFGVSDAERVRDLIAQARAAG